MLSEVRKNGRIVSPDTVASSSIKAEKSMGVMVGWSCGCSCDGSPPRPSRARSFFAGKLQVRYNTLFSKPHFSIVKQFQM
jgi:hypothetical protein